MQPLSPSCTQDCLLPSPALVAQNVRPLKRLLKGARARERQGRAKDARRADPVRQETGRAAVGRPQGGAAAAGRRFVMDDVSEESGGEGCSDEDVEALERDELLRHGGFIDDMSQAAPRGMYLRSLDSPSQPAAFLPMRRARDVVDTPPMETPPPMRGGPDAARGVGAPSSALRSDGSASSESFVVDDDAPLSLHSDSSLFSGGGARACRARMTASSEGGSSLASAEVSNLRSSVGAELVHQRVRVYWSGDGAWYHGIVVRFDATVMAVRLKPLSSRPIAALSMSVDRRLATLASQRPPDQRLVALRLVVGP